jgi:RNA polymerase sigma-70 factor (ECF subfamily)
MAPFGAADDAPDRVLAQVAQRYRRALHAYFRRRVDPPHECEDLAQDVLLRLARRTAGDDIRDVQPYLFQTANSVLTDHYRRRAARGHALTEAYDEDLHARADVVSPEQHLIDREARERLHAQIAALPERSREAFVLFRFEGMRQAEIAAHMGISISAVEKHVKLGMVRIAAALAETE